MNHLTGWFSLMKHGHRTLPCQSAFLKELSVYVKYTNLASYVWKVCIFHPRSSSAVSISLHPKILQKWCASFASFEVYRFYITSQMWFCFLSKIYVKFINGNKFLFFCIHLPAYLKALNGLICADVAFRNYLLTHAYLPPCTPTSENHFAPLMQIHVMWYEAYFFTDDGTCTKCCRTRMLEWPRCSRTFVN